MESGIYNPWEHVISIIESYGGKMRYPNKDAEYDLIYIRIHSYIPANVTQDIRQDIRHLFNLFCCCMKKRNNDSFYCGSRGFLKSEDEVPLSKASIWYDLASQMYEALVAIHLVKQCSATSYVVEQFLRKQTEFNSDLSQD